jgi:hypothetical protein
VIVAGVTGSQPHVRVPPTDPAAAVPGSAVFGITADSVPGSDCSGYPARLHVVALDDPPAETLAPSAGVSGVDSVECTQVQRARGVQSVPSSTLQPVSTTPSHGHAVRRCELARATTRCGRFAHAEDA